MTGPGTAPTSTGRLLGRRARGAAVLLALVLVAACGGERDRLDLEVGDPATVPRSEGSEVVVTVHEAQLLAADPVEGGHRISVLLRATIAVPEGSRALPFQGDFSFVGTVATGGTRLTDEKVLMSEPGAPDPRLPSAAQLRGGDAITGWVLLSGFIPPDGSEVWVSYVLPNETDPGASWRLPAIP
jgi:hypothetical protein